ncbi:MAG TPA: DNA primase [Ktedonobacterales bacterium]|nr:DNA primase [Ktedonobacterales bacterium]
MATQSLSITERIKQKLDIVEQIGSVVELKKSGKAFKGLCPFHGERTPSFYVFPETGTWRCFGCNEGGDVFTFFEKQQGLDFHEALTMLAERAGIPLESGSREGGEEEARESSGRQRLRALNEAAAIWFHHQLLQSPEAQYARSYLDSRGVSNESIAHWRLGYAPDGDTLARYLVGQGYTAKELVEAGLARERESDKSLYDYFRNRLIFPIREGRGQTVAFGGRELGGGHPKYLNTPQTVLFDKSATLYGLDLAREGIRRTDRVVIVEGYMDAVVTHQYNYRNVVACIGSAITEKHIKQIKKLTRRVTLALDPDAAGESATLRGITVAQQAFDRVVVPIPGPLPDSLRARERGWSQKGKRGEPRGMVRFEEQVDAEITVARLPAHEDPDEFVRRDPPGWQQAIDQAQPLIDFLIDAETEDLALNTPQGKLEAKRRLLPVIAAVRDRTLVEDYVGRLALKIRVDKVELRQDLQAARQQLDREMRTPRRSNDEQGVREAETQETVEQLGGKSSSAGQLHPGPSYSASGTNGSALRGLGGELLAEQHQEEYCLGLLLEHAETWPDIAAIVDERDFTGTELRALYGALATALRAGSAVDEQTFAEGLPEVLQEVAVRVRARITPGVPEEGPALSKVASAAAYRLKRMRLKAEMAELDYLERDAEQTGDLEALRSLLARKQQLLLQRRAVDAASALYG